MESCIESENASLRRQLDSLLQEARRNEEKLARFDLFERRLIATRTLAEVIRLLQADYRAAFDLDVARLVLVDPEYELARLLGAGEGGQEAVACPGLLESAAPLERLFGGCGCPVLSAFDAARHGKLFKPDGPTPASVALLPLVSQGRLIGSLNLGSLSPERFAAGNGTDFLGRLAAIAAVCLENACNHERLQLIGLTDPLTGVHNRRYFDCRLQEEATRSLRHGVPLSCMFIDIDRFKRINDTHGHRAGDEILRAIAGQVKGMLRGCDIFARYGGEEFVVLLPETPLAAAADIAERIRAGVAARPVPLPTGERVAASVSIGVSTLEDEGADCTGLAARMVERADRAVYRAKEEGRDRVAIAPDPIQPRPATRPGNFSDSRVTPSPAPARIDGILSGPFLSSIRQRLRYSSQGRVAMADHPDTI